MRTRWLAVSAVLVLSGLAPAAEASDAARIERGRYLVASGGCHDCHTPKKMEGSLLALDETRLLSGHPAGSTLPPPPKLAAGPWIISGTWDLTAWSGPWGISYATNLTPHENTGIGIWTEEMFLKAITTGRHMGASRPILPPMPWETIKNYSAADLGAIFAYLKSLPPIENRVPEPQILEPPVAEK